MNILNIAIKEIKRDFRDVRTLAFQLAFPIVLMLILGAALSSAFSTTVSVGDIHVIYHDGSTDTNVSHFFQGFIKSVASSDVHFTKATSDAEAKKEVKENKVDGYVEVTDDGIKLFESDSSSIEASIIQGMVTAYADKYNVVSVVEQVAPNEVNTALTGAANQSFIKEASLNAVKQPGSMDYYAIAMTTMIAMFGAMGASFLNRGERIRGTANRLLAAPISKAEIFIGKILGGILTNALCALIIILFSKYILKSYWGSHLGMVFLIILTEILLATSFGLGVSFITKTEGAQQAVIMVVIQLAAFFGGSYFPIKDASSFGGIVAEMSPIMWANHSLLKLIYSNEFWPAINTSLLNVGLSALFLSIAVVSLRRREGL